MKTFLILIRIVGFMILRHCFLDLKKKLEFKEGVTLTPSHLTKSADI